MYQSKVLDKLKHGKVAFGTCLHLPEPAIFEMTAALSFDAIWLDLEHHAPSVVQAQELIRAARAGGPVDIVVRPGKGEFMRMGRLLEAGAHGIMYPRCESPEEAAEVVRWAKFAPIGERGFDGAGADSDYMAHSMGEYLRRANSNTFIIVQVEDQRSVERCDQLIQVPGVDMLMLGPADLSVLIGRPGEIDHPTIVDAQRRVAAAAKAAGKHWASTSTSIDHARKLVQMGASLVFNGADIVFVRRGLTSLLESFAQIAANPELNGATTTGATKIQHNA
jgi:4-hydroxy-2-oxoheptanedioate aldolase